jgi:hypothetical protein
LNAKNLSKLGGETLYGTDNLNASMASGLDKSYISKGTKGDMMSKKSTTLTRLPLILSECLLCGIPFEREEVETNKKLITYTFQKSNGEKFCHVLKKRIMAKKDELF